MNDGERMPSIQLAQIAPLIELVADFARLAMASLSAAATGGNPHHPPAAAPRVSRRQVTRQKNASKELPRPPPGPLVRTKAYTLRDAAAHLNKAEITVRNMVKDGRLKSTLEGRRRIVMGEEIAQKLEHPSVKGAA